MKCSQVLLLVFTVFITIITSALSIECPRGTFKKNERCIKCPPGTFQKRLNRKSCEPCAAGTYFPSKGAIRFTNCLECPVGTFSKRGAARCSKCSPGTFSRRAYSKCLTCPPGSALRQFEPRCVKCPPAWYRPAGAPSTACLFCPSGTGSKVGATKCEKCAKGTFRDTQGVKLSAGFNKMINCRSCPPNTFADVKGSVQCKLCPLGTVTSQRGSLECKSCPPGTFRGLIKQRDCKPCPEGTTSFGKQPAACKHPTRGCPVNTFQDKHGECRACMPGERLDAKLRKCIRCEPDQVSLGGVTRKCKKCPQGQKPANANSIFEKSRCECDEGTVSDGAGGCKKCPAGTGWKSRPGFLVVSTYSRDFRDTESFCEDCEPGFFSDKPGMTCTPCPIGSYSNHGGSTKCRSCPTGSVSPAIEVYDELEYPFRNTCLSERSGCTLGSALDERGFCELRRCLRGSFPSLRWGCSRCSIGEFHIPGTEECEKCPRGETNPSGSFKKCVVCPKDAEGDENGRCQCKGKFGDDGKGGCKKCRFGELSTAGACGPCPENSFYKMTKDGPVCRKCRGDTIKLKPSHFRCTKCPPGFKKELDVFGREVNRCVPNDLYPIESEV